jgi:hypothetical protein
VGFSAHWTANIAFFKNEDEQLKACHIRRPLPTVRQKLLFI